MKTIFKYELEVTDTQMISLPDAAQILSVQRQETKIVMWALVETTAALREAKIHMYGTGNPMTQHRNTHFYVATVQDHRGLVWHVFLDTTVLIQADTVQTLPQG